MSEPVNTIGILGAGKVGIVLAQLARKAGYDVLISGSGDPEKIRMSIEVLAPGSHALSSKEVAEQSDVVILALPLSKYKSIPVDALAGKIVVDAMNYWWEVDGKRSSTLPDETPSSIAVQELLKDSRVVKALNHMGYHHLHDEAREKGAEGRKSIAVAGDLHENNKIVANIIEAIGFDHLCIGSLADGVRLEPGHPAFGANVTKDELEKITQP